MPKLLRMKAKTLQGFVLAHTAFGSTVCTDDLHSYRDMPIIVGHEAVKYSAKEYMKDQVNVNGMESFWAMMKRGYRGTYHHVSVKHLSRYVKEFAGRHNARSLDTIDQMRDIAIGLNGKRLKYDDLIS